jgi:hypothetical protein
LFFLRLLDLLEELTKRNCSISVLEVVFTIGGLVSLVDAGVKESGA